MSGKNSRPLTGRLRRVLRSTPVGTLRFFAAIAPAYRRTMTPCLAFHAGKSHTRNRRPLSGRLAVRFSGAARNRYAGRGGGAGGAGPRSGGDCRPSSPPCLCDPGGGTNGRGGNQRKGGFGSSLRVAAPTPHAKTAICPAFRRVSGERHSVRRRACGRLGVVLAPSRPLEVSDGLADVAGGVGSLLGFGFLLGRCLVVRSDSGPPSLDDLGRPDRAGLADGANGAAAGGSAAE